MTFTTTTENIEGRRNGIRISEAPQTLIDAVRITRHLGIRYLWMDGLCICQDDDDDWARESGRMSVVYTNAHLVIAANRSGDSNGGCFHRRSLGPTTVVDLSGEMRGCHTTVLFPSDKTLFWIREGVKVDDFKSQPLSSRGWGFQERVLARRVLHYNAQQMYFECGCGIVAEDGARLQWGVDNFQFRDVDLEDSAPLFETEDKDKTLHIWYKLVGEYHRRELTKVADRLPAISGLAKMFRQKLDAHYIAGLWSWRLVRSLAFQPDGTNQVSATWERCTGPSWSWVGKPGLVKWAHLDASPPWIDIAEIQGWHVELKHESNLFGETKSGWISVRGPTVAIQACGEQIVDQEFCIPSHAGMSEVRFDFIIWDDHELCSGEASPQRYWALRVMFLGGNPPLLDVLRMSKRRRVGGKAKEENHEAKATGQSIEKKPKFGFLYGLVLKESDGKVQHGLERVGCLYVEYRKVSFVVEDEKRWEILKLI